MFLPPQSYLTPVSTDTDRVGIVIPVYNDPFGLETTINSILTNTTHPHYTLHIVDNYSTDNTVEIAKQYTGRDHVYLHNETDIQSSYAARNTGIDATTEPILVFLDADQRVVDGWLTACLNQLEDAKLGYLAPDIELDTGKNPGVVSRYNETSGFPIKDFIEHHRYAPTSCLFVRRSLIEAVGQFDDRLISGGDMEFGNRVDNAGYELGYRPEVAVIHPTRGSARALISRNIRIGRGHCQLQRYYPDRYGRIGIPPRPSGIRQEQYDGSLDPRLYKLIALLMTAARGVGYYRECLSVFKSRFRRRLTSVFK